MFDANIFYPAALLNADDDERQKPENWIVIGWLPIYDDSKAKKLRGYEIIPARKTRLFHDCWKAILRKWEEKTKDTRDILWADTLRRQPRFFLGAFLGDQQVFSKSLKKIRNCNNLSFKLAGG